LEYFEIRWSWPSYGLYGIILPLEIPSFTLYWVLIKVFKYDMNISLEV